MKKYSCLVALLTLSCAFTDEPPGEQAAPGERAAPGEQSAPLINGEPVGFFLDPATTGIAVIDGSVGPVNGSVVAKKRWLLLYRELTYQDGLELTHVIFHPSVDVSVVASGETQLAAGAGELDIALVRLRDPLPIWFDQHDIFRGNSDSVVGRNCRAWSYGPVLPDNNGWGVLRYTLLPLWGVGTIGGPVGSTLIAGPGQVPGTSLFQYGWYGDSGSPCFVDDKIVGVLKSVVTEDQLTLYVKTEVFRDWVDSIIFDAGSRDLNADDSPDLVLANGSGAFRRLYLKRPAGEVYPQVIGYSPSGSLGVWDVAGSGDFNGDGRGDLVYRWGRAGDAQTGTVLFELKQEDTVLYESLSVPDLAWRIAAVADLNGDGVSDLVWRNIITGHDAFWIMAEMTGHPYEEFAPAAVRASGAFQARTDLDWEIAAVADFDSYEMEQGVLIPRTTPDIMWRNAATGEMQLWLMDWWYGTYGRRTTVALAQGRDPGWSVGAVGDYDDDGLQDLVWYCDTSLACGNGLELWRRTNPYMCTTEGQPEEPWRRFEFETRPLNCGTTPDASTYCDLDSYAPAGSDSGWRVVAPR
ncbi:MAG: VCBS repeat-containing protein [Gemmatimonadota bacterium]